MPPLPPFETPPDPKMLELLQEYSVSLVLGAGALVMAVLGYFGKKSLDSLDRVEHEYVPRDEIDKKFLHVEHKIDRCRVELSDKLGAVHARVDDILKLLSQGKQ